MTTDELHVREVVWRVDTPDLHGNTITRRAMEVALAELRLPIPCMHEFDPMREMGSVAELYLEGSDLVAEIDLDGIPLEPLSFRVGFSVSTSVVSEYGVTAIHGLSGLHVSSVRHPLRLPGDPR